MKYKKPKILLEFAKYLRQTKTKYTWSDDSIILFGLRLQHQYIQGISTYNNQITYINIYPIDMNKYTGFKPVSMSFPCNNLNTLIKKLNRYVKHY